MSNNLIVSILIKLFKVSVYSLAIVHLFLLFDKEYVKYDNQSKATEIIFLLLSIIPTTIIWVLADDFNMQGTNAPPYLITVLLYLPLLIFVMKTNK